MKKKAVLRGLLGFPLGISIGYLMTIAVSLKWAQGYYSPCVPSLVEAMGSEIGAVIFQTFLCGVLGSAFAASSVIWEMDHWSMAKQIGVYLAIISLVLIPIAYFTNWMEHSVSGFLRYFGIFLLLFVIMWLATHLFWKNRLKKINTKLQ